MITDNDFPFLKIIGSVKLGFEVAAISFFGSATIRSIKLTLNPTAFRPLEAEHIAESRLR